MPESADHQANHHDDEAVLASAISELLLEGLKALAEAGQLEAACRLAGRAHGLSRQLRPDIARRFDVVLHRLTPKLA